MPHAGAGAPQGGERIRPNLEPTAPSKMVQGGVADLLRDPPGT